MLEERDDRVAPYLVVTLIGYRGYIIARLILPALVTLAFSLVIFSIFKLTDTRDSVFYIMDWGVLSGVQKEEALKID